MNQELFIRLQGFVVSWLSKPLRYAIHSHEDLDVKTHSKATSV